MSRCRDPGKDSPRLLPHWKRLAVALARVLLTAAASENPVQFAVAVEDADPGTQARGQQAAGSAHEAVPDDVDELIAYVSVRHLLGLAGSVLGQLDQRTLDLSGQREQVQALDAEVEQARRSAVLLHQGLTRPDGGTPKLGLPTPAQAAVWEELRQLDGIRREALRRDQDAARRHPGREPERWTLSGYQPDGCFTARRADGLALAGWSEVPEAVATTLAPWSDPPGSPVSVQWEQQPPRPGRRRPFDGWPRRVGVSARKAWEAQPPGWTADFAAAVAELRASWPGGPLHVRLAEAAARLNAGEPQAPLLHLASGGDRAGNVLLGRTSAAEWVNPAAVAHSGTMTWNDFGSHRPHRVGELAAALLGDLDPASLAEDTWAGPQEAVTLTRVPGPAGPLYQISGNGQHRIHTARLLGFPMLWALTSQYTLPTSIDWFSLVDGDEAPSGQVRADALACWQGALQHGLIDGELDKTGGVLHLTWALAPWLLARPGPAATWARNYDRAYPGTLAACGIPPHAWRSEQEWRHWLTGHPG